MQRAHRYWPKAAQRFISAFVVFGALFAPVVWWLFASSWGLSTAGLYWLVCTCMCGFVYAWGESPADKLFRWLPWWRE